MEAYLPFLRGQALFRGMADEDIRLLLAYFRARVRRLDKDRSFADFSKMHCWGIILEGGLTAQQEDVRGNRVILGDFGPGDFLDNNYVNTAAGAQAFSFSVNAGTSILLLEQQRILEPLEEDGSERAHLQFLRNAAQAMATRERQLLYKIEVLSKRTTREKILSYLTIQSALLGTKRFNVPYTRQELADYLAVDRSAMCTELTRMQQDGLIHYERKRFELLG